MNGILERWLATGPWRSSPGYARKDGKRVGPHSYIMEKWAPPLVTTMRQVIENHPESYKGSYGGWTYSYLRIDGWKYWTLPGVLNREELPK